MDGGDIRKSQLIYWCVFTRSINFSSIFLAVYRADVSEKKFEKLTDCERWESSWKSCWKSSWGGWRLWNHSGLLLAFGLFYWPLQVEEKVGSVPLFDSSIRTLALQLSHIIFLCFFFQKKAMYKDIMAFVVFFT